MLNELAKQAYETAVKRGQYQGNVKDVLLHLVTEVGELINARKTANYGMYEEIYKGSGFKDAYKFAVKDTMQDEGAGIIILIAGLFEHMNWDLDLAVKMAMKYNRVRKD